MNFKELIKNKKSYIKNVIFKITSEENEDLEQEVLVKIWKNSDKYKEKGKSNAWIKTVTTNIVKDHFKKKKVDQTSDTEILNTIPDKKASPEKVLDHKERQKFIINAINSLNKKQKEIILLIEIKGYSYEESSKKLKCPIGTIKSRLYNAKKELAEKLKDLM